jgi:hypothetical protein
MVTGSSFALANPHTLNLTTFFIWVWSLIPTPWSNELLRAYIFLGDLPSRVYTQITRSYTALRYSFDSDAYWFYNVEGHYIAQHMNSNVVKVHKGNPHWLYTSNTNVFSYVAPITHANTNDVVNQLVNEPVVTGRLPVIGATLYYRASVFSFEYDMSEWISSVHIVSPKNSVADRVPLSVLVLAWGLANEVCFEGDLSTMEIVLVSDIGEEKRFNVLTEAEVEEGEITAMNDDLVVSEEETTETAEAAANAEEELSSDSDSSPVPVHRPPQTTPVEDTVE